jgi:hypothetical protein
MMRCTKKSRSTVGKLTEPQPQNQIYWIGTTVKVADTAWSAKLGVITKTKREETPCLLKSTNTLQQ